MKQRKGLFTRIQPELNNILSRAMGRAKPKTCSDCVNMSLFCEIKVQRAIWVTYNGREEKRVSDLVEQAFKLIKFYIYT